MQFTKIASFIALVGAALAAPAPEPVQPWEGYGRAHELKMAQD
ncbi:hypothetical protein ACQRIT_007361 [Beauveria bassiana]